jgi:hypothetical protein
VDWKQSLCQHYTGEVNLHMQLNGSFMLHVYNHLFITLAAYICKMICCSFDSHLRRCCSYEKNIADFTINVQENIDPGHPDPDDYILLSEDNFDGCEVEHIVNRSMSINDSDEALKQNYATLIGVISLTCPDALFEGICNYLQMIKDDELLK